MKQTKFSSNVRVRCDIGDRFYRWDSRGYPVLLSTVSVVIAAVEDLFIFSRQRDQPKCPFDFPLGAVYLYKGFLKGVLMNTV